MAKKKIDKNVNVTLVDLSDNIESTVDKYIDYLQNSLTKDLSDKDTDLTNIRDEMLGTLNKLKYLLTLK